MHAYFISVEVICGEEKECKTQKFHYYFFMYSFLWIVNGGIKIGAIILHSTFQKKSAFLWLISCEQIK